MRSPPDPRLVSWIARMASDLTAEGRIEKFELWHSVEGEGGDRLSTVRMEDRPEDEDPDCLAVELWNDALDDASTRAEGSTQRYVVRVFRATNPMPEDSRAFLIPGAAVSSLVGSSSEPPTPRGMLAMEMRQTENMHAMMMRMAEASSGTLAVQLQKERFENDRLRTESRKAAALEQELLDKKHEREMEREERRQRSERMEQLFGLCTSMLPMIAARFLTPPAAAGPGLPNPDGSNPAAAASPTAPPNAAGAPPTDPLAAVAFARGAARDEAMKRFLGTLDTTQIQTVLAVLSPEQSISLMEIYESYRSDSDAAASKKDPTHPQPASSNRDSRPAKHS